MDLKGQGLNALVTGGTRGIGRAVVSAFLDEGVNVAFCARSADAVAETTQALGGSGARAHGSVVDVGDAQAINNWVTTSAAELGGIDIIVSNVSALAIPDTEESWEASINVDLLGTVRLVKAAMPYLEKSPHGSIVTISSVSGREVDFAAGPYGTIKTALVAYTQGLANQLADKGIRTIVNLRGVRDCAAYLMEVEACRRHGIALVDYPIRSREPPSKEAIRGHHASAVKIG